MKAIRPIAHVVDGGSFEFAERGKLRVDDLHLAFGGVDSLSGVSFEVTKGEILGLIGPNGAGKTCVLNCISGFYRPQKGNIYFERNEITQLPSYEIAALGVGRTFQNVELYTGMTTIENLMAGRHTLMKSNMLEWAIYFGPAQREEIKHREAVEEILDFLEIESIRKETVGMLPYGLRKRVELGRALALDPKILLLDEPMAGMNVEEKEDMARFILDIRTLKKIAVVMVEHDMGLIVDIADRVIVLDAGLKIAEGVPKEIVVDPRVVKAYIGD